MVTECPAYDEWKLNKSNGGNVTAAWRNLAHSLTPPGSGRAK